MPKVLAFLCIAAIAVYTMKLINPPPDAFLIPLLMTGVSLFLQDRIFGLIDSWRNARRAKADLKKIEEEIAKRQNDYLEWQKKQNRMPMPDLVANPHVPEDRVYFMPSKSIPSHEERESWAMTGLGGVAAGVAIASVVSALSDDDRPDTFSGEGGDFSGGGATESWDSPSSDDSSSSDDSGGGDE